MPCTCRFVGVAARWAAALLDQADQERQGVDLFGRDALVLGHVLATLVRCPGCPACPASCDPTVACVPICARARTSWPFPDSVAFIGCHPADS